MREAETLGPAPNIKRIKTLLFAAIVREKFVQTKPLLKPHLTSALPVISSKSISWSHYRPVNFRRAWCNFLIVGLLYPGKVLVDMKFRMPE